MPMQMGQAFPGMQNIHRRTIRAPVNPLDKSTVVSIFPKRIEEVKHTIQPGIFILEPGSYDKPSVLVVGPSSWWKELDEEQPLLEIPVSSIQIADSIVRDYANGILGCNMGDKMPGLFFIPGEVKQEEIKTKHKELLDKTNQAQRNWFQELVVIADVLWSKSSGNPLSISDDMRLAAQELGMKNKPWLADFSTIEMKNCPACGFLRNNSYPICQQCKTVVDVKKFQELGLKFAS